MDLPQWIRRCTNDVLVLGTPDPIDHEQVYSGTQVHVAIPSIGWSFTSHRALTRRDELPCKGTLSDLNTLEAMRARA